MNFFSSSLPREVVFKIVSYLEQRECVESMMVCHQWHREMPLYATDLWKEIVISPTSFSKANRCLTRCLGSHTQKLSIYGMESFSVLSRFIRLGCIISSLELSAAHSDKLTHDPIEDHTILLSTIKHINNSLRQLSIIDLSFELSVTDAMRHFPNLTHLTLLYDCHWYEYNLVDSVIQNNSNPDIRPYTGLVYLRLDVFLDFDHCTLPILRLCPMLKTLRLSNDGTSIDIFHLPTNFDSIFWLCPRLMHLTWNEDRYPADMRDNTLMHDLGITSASSSSSGDRKGALRTFLFNGSIDEIDRVIPILRTSRLELERVELTFWATSEPPAVHSLLSRLRFPQLKALVVSRLKMVSDDWISFLSGCQNIESLELYLFKEDLAMNTICKVVGSLEHLRHLKINRSAETWTTHWEEAAWNNAIILTKTRLQYVDLDGILLADNALLNLCDISSLKELSLSQTRFTNVSLEGLLAFAHRLASSRTRLCSLRLSHFPTLDDNVLKRLSQVRSLSFLSMQWCPKITEAGLKEFIDGDSTGIKRKVTVHNCRLISRIRGFV